MSLLVRHAHDLTFRRLPLAARRDRWRRLVPTSGILIKICIDLRSIRNFSVEGRRRLFVVVRQY